MTSRGTSTRYTVGDLLLGRERSRTRRALALAVGDFVVASALAVTLRSLRYGAVPEFVYRFQHPFLIDTGFGQLRGVSVSSDQCVNPPSGGSSANAVSGTPSEQAPTSRGSLRLRRDLARAARSETAIVIDVTFESAESASAARFSVSR